MTSASLRSAWLRRLVPMLVVTLALGACAPSAQPAGGVRHDGPGAAAAPAPSVARSGAPWALRIAAGNPDGTWYATASAIAEVLARDANDVAAVAEVTSGTLENLLLVARREAEAGVGLLHLFEDAFDGTGTFTSAALPDLRVVVMLDEHAVLFVHTDVDEALVERLATLLVERREALVERAPAAAALSVERTLALEGVLLHPGAARAYDALGAAVPGALRGD